MFHGRDSSILSHLPNGVGTRVSLVRNAICESIFQACSIRARSSTSPARVTAGEGSMRYCPGDATSIRSPGQAISWASPGSTLAIRRGAPADGDQSTASLSDLPTATNSSPQSSGTRSRSMPGAAFITTVAALPASSRHQSRLGWYQPSPRRLPSSRRDGSMKTLRRSPICIFCTSATTKRAFSATPYASAFSRAHATLSASASIPTTRRCAARKTESPPTPQHRSRTWPSARAANCSALCRATTSAEACSSPSFVKNISLARVYFPAAFLRNVSCCSAMATSSLSHFERNRITSGAEDRSASFSRSAISRAPSPDLSDRSRFLGPLRPERPEINSVGIISFYYQLRPPSR